MAKRQKPSEKAKGIFKSKYMIFSNLWLGTLLIWGIYETYAGNTKPIWLVLSVLTIMLFNWSIYMENLVRIEDEMYGRKK